MRNLALSRFLLFVASLAALAESASALNLNMNARPKRSSTLEDFFYTGNATTAPPGSNLTIRTYLTCFGTNLRSVQNPLSPMATVMLSVGVGPNANPAPKNGYGDLTVLFPGWMVLDRRVSAGAWQRQETINLTPYLKRRANTEADLGGVALGFQNIVIVRPSVAAVPDITSSFDRALHYVTFEQNLLARGNCWGTITAKNSLQGPIGSGLNAFLNLFNPLAKAAGGFAAGPDNTMGKNGYPPDDGWYEPSACDGTPGSVGWDPAAWPGYSIATVNQLRRSYSHYVGRDGPLSAQWRHAFSNDYKTLEIYASFPGETSACGGFFSPLMLFFKKTNLKFEKLVDFEVFPGAPRARWPEATADTAWLAYDANGDGKINDGDELFGAGVDFANGFESLRRYDRNFDGRIDRSDAIFSKLRLWRDRTGRGETRPQDLTTLASEGVIAIDLDYRDDLSDELYGRAQLKERSAFIFKRDGKIRRGEVIDVWLSNK